MKNIKSKSTENYKSALFWEKKQNDDIICTLCPHECVIAPGQVGACKARKNIDGKMISLNFGLACASIDPIEKKPLFHWRPGSRTLSFGTFGCNLFCPFCQNFHLSRTDNGSGLHKATPRDILSIAYDTGLNSVSFTYNEPTVWFEFVIETSILIKKHKLETVLVTNGYISPAPRDELLGFTDAINIDLKGFSDETYSLLGGSLNPVLETITAAYRKGVHIEITHLVVPGINDSMAEFRAMTHWIRKISPNIPLHITKYFPAHNWDHPPTSREEINQRIQVAEEDLNYVFSGNLGLGNNTICPNCGEMVISRPPFDKLHNFLSPEGKCPFCDTPLGIVTK